MAWSPLPGLFRPRVQRVCAAWRSWGQQGPATGQPRVSGTGVRPSADPPERPPRQAAGSGSPRVNSGSFSSPRAPQNPLSNGFQSMSSKARGAEDPWASGQCAELLAGPYEQWIRERGRGDTGRSGVRSASRGGGRRSLPGLAPSVGDGGDSAPGEEPRVRPQAERKSVVDGGRSAVASPRVGAQRIRAAGHSS